MFRFSHILLLTVAVGCGVGHAQTDPFLFFEKEVRPLLIERCYECHSEKKQKGGLRLDSAAAVLKGGDSGPALVSGDPKKSKIMEGISWTDPDFQMPPKNKLSDSEIAVLANWIKMGAPDPRTNDTSVVSKPIAADAEKGWAYQPVRKVESPKTRNTKWSYNNVDRFILAKLESKKLAPVKDADKATLARRTYYALSGLPPTPEEMENFIRNKSRNAFPELIDKLLASPRFGERWGRHWLDVARYAESVTLRGILFPGAWRYRDYVIEAFNQNLPYDQFIREQIAGDLLPASETAQRQRQTIATTFLALGNTNLEEQDKGQLRMDIVDEQLDTIGKAFLAQTFGCARCHDHKFDPIPTRDYYAMAGILRNVRTLIDANVSKVIAVPLPLEPDQEEVYKKHETEIAALETEIKKAKDKANLLAGKSGEPKNAELATVIQPTDLPGIIVDSSQARQVGQWKLSQLSKSYIGDGYLHDENSGKGEKTLTFLPEIKTAGKYEVRLAYAHTPNRAPKVPVTVFHADGETTVYINQKEAPSFDGHFVSLGQFRFEKSGFASVLVANEGTKGHVIADAVQFLPLENLDATVKTAKVSSPDEEALKILEAKLKKLQDSVPKRPQVMSIKEEEQIADTQIHIRGNVHNLGPIVPRGFLQVATIEAPPKIPDNQSGRREFADWIVTPSNPLTARVMVNRIWHWLFGVGLVRTTDNFGMMGETPSHLELLDYLANRFIEEKWSVKKMIREIMLSHTYQLTSETNGKPTSDPENKLLAHFNRNRLDAESIRDTILAISGELKLDMGGMTFAESTTADYSYLYTEPRRSVYVPAFRNSLPEIFEVFDFADPSMVTGARNVSTVAPQALFLMNHPWVRDQSQRAAEKLLAKPEKNDRARLNQLYQISVGRLPTAGEAAVALAFIKNEANSLEAWTQVFQAVFASIDFRYLN